MFTKVLSKSINLLEWEMKSFLIKNIIWIENLYHLSLCHNITTRLNIKRLHFTRILMSELPLRIVSKTVENLNFFDTYLYAFATYFFS